MTSSRTLLPLPLLLLILVTSIRSGECQGGGANISLGFILTAAASNPSSLSSQPRGTFAFGFAPQADNQLKLGIWYAGDASQFLVWTAGRNVLASPGAIAELTQEGDLVLYASSARSSILWSSGTSRRGVVRGQLLDSGNLLLENATTAALWSSFQNLTDTLLPGQDLVAAGAKLTTAPRSPLTSRYTLAMESSGNLTLLWNNDLPYWASDTSGSGRGPVPTVARFDANGVLNLLLNSSSSSADNVTQFFGSDYGQGPLRRLSLDEDGNLRIYSLAGTGGWTVQWQAVGNQCQVYGFCGAFGICTYSSGSSSASAPVCICPPGLAPNDPKEVTKGCSGTGNITQCGASNSRLVQNNNTAWLVYRSEQSSRFSVNNNQEGCKSSCLNDVACVACLVPNDGSGNCIQFRSTFVSGYSFAFLQATAFLKVCNSAANAPPMAAGLLPPSRGSCSAKSATIGISVAATLAGIILAEALLGWICCRSRTGGASRYMRAPPATARHAVLDYASGAPVRFSYKELQNATNNFSNKIGEGGFGAVYKGFLPAMNNKGTAAIAVKKLEGVFQGDKEFRTEVATIGSTHHMNLMHLVGFCSEGSSVRLLVYEYMPNGSLDKFLFFDHHDEEQQQQQESIHSMHSMAAAVAESVEEDEKSVSLPLDWKTRFSIAVGTAKGIAYLHEECRECIVHCDLKPENILLDDAFRPKVSDFGLARLIGEGHTRSFTTVRGTRGYMAPEWLANMPITAKSDVFSYGMILLELIAGRRNFDSSGAIAPEKRRFPWWAFREMEAGRISGIVDQRLISSGGGGSGGGVDLVQLERMVRVAFWCVQDNAQHRPSTSKVVQMLEGNLAVPQPPMPKFLDGSSSSSSSSATTATSATTTNRSTNLSSSSSSQMP